VEAPLMEVAEAPLSDKTHPTSVAGLEVVGTMQCCGAQIHASANHLCLATRSGNPFASQPPHRSAYILLCKSRYCNADKTIAKMSRLLIFSHISGHCCNSTLQGHTLQAANCSMLCFGCNLGMLVEP
jgi:hypothetical protein